VLDWIGLDLCNFFYVKSNITKPTLKWTELSCANWVKMWKNFIFH